jgi:effector-binding domain-containing protein
MNYEIKIRDIEPVLAATLRFNGRHKDAGKCFPDIYKALKGQSAGSPFFCYYDKEFKEIADIELCVPVSEKKELRGIMIRELPRIKAVSTVHTGSYETISNAYKALSEYILEKQLFLYVKFI